MQSDFVVQTWIEGKSEYRVLAMVGATEIAFSNHSRRIGTTEWLPENQIVRMQITSLMRVLREMELT